jgi:hypothetical protein
MSLLYSVFLDCSDRCDDPHMADVFFGLAYGLMPFCVTEDVTGGSLHFRRSFGPTEKDKALRTAAANEELSALPALQWYHAGAAAREWTDHLQPVSGPTLRVAWSIGKNPVEAHLRVVPALIGWTKWERDTPWATMRRRLHTEAGSIGPNVMLSQRHHRQAQILDFVGMRALESEGRTPEQAAAYVVRAAAMIADGTMAAVFGPNGEVVDVTVVVTGGDGGCDMDVDADGGDAEGEDSGDADGGGDSDRA